MTSMRTPGKRRGVQGQGTCWVYPQPVASLTCTLVYNHLDMGWGATGQTRQGQSDTLDAH